MLAVPRVESAVLGKAGFLASAVADVDERARYVFVAEGIASPAIHLTFEHAVRIVALAVADIVLRLTSCQC